MMSVATSSCVRGAVAVSMALLAMLTGCGGGRSTDSDTVAATTSADASAAPSLGASAANAATAATPHLRISRSLQGADISVDWSSTKTARVKVVAPDGVASVTVLQRTEGGADVFSVGTKATDGTVNVLLPDPGTQPASYLSAQLKSGNVVELPL